MPQLIRILPVIAIAALAACDSRDQTRDFGINSGPLEDLEAGIWIDPNGCHHWIIDDGIEGYMSARLDRSGKPVCTDIGEPETAVWDFKRGSNVSDGLF